MEYIEEIQEQVILVGVQLDENDNVKESLDELEELADTAGAQTVGKIIQNRETVHPGTYIGKGKIEEVRALMLATDATGIICDDELSPAQMNNLEHELECKVMDRTLLILDIFAKHATTSEGKIQVELAQLRYRASRLVGLGASLSRLGGGIGTRGPGEKKLESDRRLIRKRITALKEELSQVEKHRELLRTGRTRGKMKTAAIVGYTNAGKSTLLNTLTGAGVLSEDKLFATLDPTTRALTLDDGPEKTYGKYHLPAGTETEKYLAGRKNQMRALRVCSESHPCTKQHRLFPLYQTDGKQRLSGLRENPQRRI